MILMLLDGEYLKDIRVIKEAEGIVKRGIGVTVMCPRRKGQLSQEESNGVKIVRVGKNYNFYKKGIYDILASINFIHPLFKAGIKKLLKEVDISHIHVHDLPLAKTGWVFKKQISGNVVLDLHENYPEGLKVWSSWKKNPFIRLKNYIFFGYKRWLKYEREMCEKADILVVVVDEMKTRLSKIHGVNTNKMVVVTNSEKKSFIENESETTLASNYKENFLISYIGGIGPHRGLDTALRGLAKVTDKIPRIKFIIVGSGSKQVIQHLKAIVKEEGIENYVSFLGYHPFSQVWGLMKNSDVNIIPHTSNTHTDNTIPHKLYQIMMSGKALLVSDCAPLKRVVSTLNSGFIFKADDASSFGEKLLEINAKPEDVKRRSENGYNATVLGEHNWETEVNKLINIYN